ncbi:MAG TPA: diaminopimelate epimerase [Methylomirabilota bacterium]
MNPIPFAKGHGLGNDYIVMSRQDLPFDLSEASIVRICDRNWGIGSDGILMRVATTRADFGLRIFNPDGSEAEKSGNGLRIFAKWLRDHGHAKQDRFTVDTKGGVVECHCRTRAGRVQLVIVEMGRATFRAPDIPMNGPDRDVVAVPLQLGDGSTVSATAVSVGNPHCVVFVDHLDSDHCRRVGPLIENHPAFPRRTNVQFAKVTDKRTLDILIWERGAGYTLASGSSSCGAASAAVKNGFCEHGRVTVRMPGGDLTIDVRPDWSLKLEGPVEEVYSGALTAEFAEAWLTPATP